MTLKNLIRILVIIVPVIAIIWQFPHIIKSAEELINPKPEYGYGECVKYDFYSIKPVKAVILARPEIYDSYLLGLYNDSKGRFSLYYTDLKSIRDGNWEFESIKCPN